MRHKLVNFTRGSQLIGHFGFMFAAGLKGPALVALATFGGLIWWRLNATLTDQESYLSLDAALCRRLHMVRVRSRPSRSIWRATGTRCWSRSRPPPSTR